MIQGLIGFGIGALMFGIWACYLLSKFERRGK